MRKPNRSLSFVMALIWLTILQLGFGGVLPEFAYREVNVKFSGNDGKPISGAAIYGFSRESNLLWPRRDHLVKNRNDVLWDESFMGKTGADGAVKAIVPPGKWGFCAVTQSNGMIVAGWSDFRERAAGNTVLLAPTATKHWTLCATNTALIPKRVFLKPQGFPVWIPATLPPGTESILMEIPAGNFYLWAEGDATDNHPGFAIGWGYLNSGLADGRIASPDRIAAVECRGGGGTASLRWARRQAFGLEGELHLCQNATVLLSSGPFSVGYTRPLAAGLRGNFIGQLYTFPEWGRVSLNLDTPLFAGLEQIAAKGNKKGQTRLIAQLYLVDGNGHILHELSDTKHNPVDLNMAVIVNGQRSNARAVTRRVETPKSNEEEDETETDKAGQMLFAADVPSVGSYASAVWEVTSPPDFLSQTRFTVGERVIVTTKTFKMAVPKVIVRDSQNLLNQAEALAAVMSNATGRKRHSPSTSVIIDPSRRGASGVHNGSRISISTRLFFSDAPMSEHGVVHELGHNFNFFHGGLHETAVESCRCAGAEQITEQPAKWMFMDRMNGITREETPYKKYPNVGLYLHCYAQGGLNFLRFMSANEDAVLRKSKPQDYTNDELTTALLNLGTGRDMTSICRNYGLNVTQDRVIAAVPVVRSLCQKR